MHRVFAMKKVHFRDFHRGASGKPVRHFKPGKLTVNEAIEQFSGMGFGARKLSMATDIWERMIRDKDCFKMMSVSGAMVPGGMKECLIEIVRSGWVDVLVTTGANLTHDLAEACGTPHLLGTEKADDSKLRVEGINRIYDVYMPNNAYEGIEDFLQPILNDLSGKRYSIRQLLLEIGKKTKGDSLIRACYENKVELYCPALADSGIGLQLWYFLHNNDINVDAFLDLKDIVSRAWDAKRTGAAIIGGGVPKNFILQTLQATDKEHTYAFQVMADRPEYGGLSGAPLREGVSWGKIDPKSNTADLVCDATIAVPLMVSALRERIGTKG